MINPCQPLPGLFHAYRTSVPRTVDRRDDACVASVQVIGCTGAASFRSDIVIRAFEIRPAPQREMTRGLAKDHFALRFRTDIGRGGHRR